MIAFKVNVPSHFLYEAKNKYYVPEPETTTTDEFNQNEITKKFMVEKVYAEHNRFIVYSS